PRQPTHAAPETARPETRRRDRRRSPHPACIDAAIPAVLGRVFASTIKIGQKPGSQKPGSESTFADTDLGRRPTVLHARERENAKIRSCKDCAHAAFPPGRPSRRYTTRDPARQRSPPV